MTASLIIQTIVNAIVLGSLYSLMAVGLSLCFGVMKMANFAHGELVMAGAYAVFFFYSLNGVPFPVAVLLAIVVVAVIGIAVNYAIFVPTEGNILAGFMATAGLSFVLQVIAGQIWGFGQPKAVETPYMGAANVFGAAIGWQRVLVIPLTAAALLLLWFVLTRTKPGKALRACAQDPEAASLQGISPRAVAAWAMAMAGASAGLAGALMATIFPVTPYMGHNAVLVAFVVVVLGGMSSVQGVVVAAFILAAAHTISSTIWDSVIGMMVGVALMAIILVLRPQGLVSGSAR